MKLLLSIVFFTIYCYAIGQETERPVIGRLCPDFAVRNVMDDKDSVLQFSTLKGKFVILDFWSKLCSGAVGSFPATERIYRAFKDKVTFLLIGLEDKERRLRPMFAKAREKMNLTIPYSFDSSLFNRFVPNVVPNLIWIDNRGIVRAVTTSRALTEANVEAFLNGRSFTFYDWSFAAVEKREREDKPYNYQEPFFLNGNGGVTETYASRSVLVPFESGKMKLAGFPVNVNRVLKYHPKPWLLQGCATLEELYLFAYTGYPRWFFRDSLYGKVFPKCILQISDSSLFKVDWEKRMGYYCYSLMIEPRLANENHLLIAMQNDLWRSFGYTVQIETRKMPCWVITATRKAKKLLKSKGGASVDDRIEPAEVSLTNVTMKNAMASIFHKQTELQLPIIEESGIHSNIDIYLNANLYDFEDIKHELKKLGIMVNRASRKMKVIVISD